MAAFKLEDLVCITAGNTSVELTFNETGMFNREAGTGGDDEAGLENSLAILTVTDAATARFWARFLKFTVILQSVGYPCLSSRIIGKPGRVSV